MNTPFLTNYRQLKIPIVDDSGASAWPELFPISKIDELRNTVGARHFSAQMMLEYISPDRARIDPGALKFYDGEFDVRSGKIDIGVSRLPPVGGEWRANASRGGAPSESNNINTNIDDTEEEAPSRPSHFVRRDDSPPQEGGHATPLITGSACYWDPSGGRHRADGSVIVMLYRDDKNRAAFIHDMKYLMVDDSDPHPLATQCERVLDFMTRHGQSVIGIEVNGIGNALPEILRDVAMRRGAPANIQKIINHQQKEMRILDAIEPLISTGRLWAHERIRATPVISEMIGWTPIGGIDHDDGLDAIAGALRMTPIPVRPRVAAMRPIAARTEFKI